MLPSLAKNIQYTNPDSYRLQYIYRFPHARTAPIDMNIVNFYYNELIDRIAYDVPLTRLIVQIGQNRIDMILNNTNGQPFIRFFYRHGVTQEIIIDYAPLNRQLFYGNNNQHHMTFRHTYNFTNNSEFDILIDNFNDFIRKTNFSNCQHLLYQARYMDPVEININLDVDPISHDTLKPGEELYRLDNNLGSVYQHASLQTWFQQSCNNPLTNLPVTSIDKVVNRNMKTRSFGTKRTINYDESSSRLRG